MAKKVEKQVVIKRVNPYPISAQVMGEGVQFVGSIHKATTRGVFLEIGQQLVSLGQNFEVSFELPVFHVRIRAKAVVMKFVDRIKEPTKEELMKLQPREKLKPQVQRLAELHFENLPQESRQAIERFCLRINQSEL